MTCTYEHNGIIYNTREALKAALNVPNAEQSERMTALYIQYLDTLNSDQKPTNEGFIAHLKNIDNEQFPMLSTKEYYSPLQWQMHMANTAEMFLSEEATKETTAMLLDVLLNTRRKRLTVGSLKLELEDKLLRKRFSLLQKIRPELAKMKYNEWINMPEDAAERDTYLNEEESWATYESDPILYSQYITIDNIISYYDVNKILRDIEAGLYPNPEEILERIKVGERETGAFDDAGKPIKEPIYFLGYANKAMVKLGELNIIQASNNISTTVTLSDDGPGYTARYDDGWALRVNPKSTLGLKTKILLNRIPVIEKVRGENTYIQKSTSTGFPAYIPYAPVFEAVSTLAINAKKTEFEYDLMTNPRYNNDPMINAVRISLNKVKDKNEVEYKQMVRQLSNLNGLKENGVNSLFIEIQPNKNPVIKLQKGSRVKIGDQIVAAWQGQFMNHAYENNLLIAEYPEDALLELIPINYSINQDAEFTLRPLSGKEPRIIKGGFDKVFNDEINRIFEDESSGSLGDLSAKGYLNIAYAIKNILGIELVEGDWNDKTKQGFQTAEVLKNLNEVKEGNKKTYLSDYIKRGEVKSFSDLIKKTIGDRIVNTIAANIESGKYDSNTPFKNSSTALDLLQNIFKSYHKSVTNSQARNINGDNEYTQVPAEMFHHQVEDLKDPEHILELHSLPIGKYNPFINDQIFENLDTGETEVHIQPYWSSMKDDTISGIQLERRRNKIVLEARKAGMNDADILSLLYYEGTENNTKNKKNANRGTARYYMPFGDSSSANSLEAPKYDFDYDIVGKDIKLRDGFLRERFYGLFKSEVNRAITTLQEYKNVNENSDLSLKEKMDQLDPSYHYYQVGDTLMPGAGTNLYFWGQDVRNYSKDLGLFETMTTGGKTYAVDLKDDLLDDNDELNDEMIRKAFDSFFDEFITKEINIKMDLMKNLQDQLFKLTDVENEDEEGRFNSPAFKSNIIGNDYIRTVKNLFSKSSTVDGKKLSEYNKDTYASAKEARENGYHNKLLQAAIIDHQLNHMLAVTNFRQLTWDYAALDEKGDWNKFLGNSIKRDKAYVSPYTRTATNSKVRYVAFEDVFFKDSTIKLSEVEESFSFVEKALFDFMNANGFEEYITDVEEVVDGKTTNHRTIPARYKQLAAIFYALKLDKRNDAFIARTLKSTLNSTITDGGSIITLKEHLFQELQEGSIDENEYHELYDIYIDPDLVWDPTERERLELPPLPVLKLKGHKMVAAGAYVEGNRKVPMYMKDSKRVIIPAMAKGTRFEAILQDLHKLEGGKGAHPEPGIQLVPRSALKLSNAHYIKLFDNDGNIIPHGEISETGKRQTNILNARVNSFPRNIYGRQVQNPDKHSADTKISNQLLTNMFLNLSDNMIIGDDLFASPDDGFVGRTVGSKKVKPPTVGLTKLELYNSLLDIARELKEKELQNFIDSFGLDYSITNEWKLAKAKWLSLLPESYKGPTDNEAFETTVRNMIRSKDPEARARGKELQFQKYEFVARNLQKMLQDIKEQAVAKKGVDVSQLRVLDEMIIAGKGINQIQQLKMSLTFTPGNKQYQQVVLAEINNLISGTRINGTSVVQAAQVGNEQADESNPLKQKLKGSDTVKGYELTYDSEGKVNGFSYAEIQMPWFFKDKNGRLLDYNKYVNPDGTPKFEMWSPEMLEIIGYRIPNTGMNMAGVFRISRFMHPSEGDVALIPDIIYSQWGADLDFDKMYNYAYHFDMKENGRLEKVKGVINLRQHNAEEILTTPESIDRAIDIWLMDTDKTYRTNKMLFDKAFRAYTNGLEDIRDSFEEEDNEERNLNMGHSTSNMSSKSIKKTMEDARREKNKEAMDLIKESFKDKENPTPQEKTRLEDAIQQYELEHAKLLKTYAALENRINKVRDKFDMHEFLTGDRIPNAFLKLQTRAQLENAYIDIFKMVMSDLRNLPTMLTPLNTDLIMDELNDKRFNGKSYIELQEQVQSAPNTEAGQIGNAARMRSGGSMIGILANASETAALMHTGYLSLGDKVPLEDTKEEIPLMRPIAFLDENESIIEEPPASHYISGYENNKNTIKGYKVEPMMLRTNKGTSVKIPNKLYTIKDVDNDIEPIKQLQSALQAYLDLQKGPTVVYSNLNPATINASLIINNLGYKKHLIPFIQQPIIVDYANAKLTEDSPFVGDNNYLYNIIVDHIDKAGLPVSIFTDNLIASGGDVYRALESSMSAYKIGVAEYKHDKFFSVAQLNNMIAQKFGEAEMDQNYYSNQLHVLRVFLRANNVGDSVFDLQQRLNLQSKGVKGNSLLGLSDQMYKVSQVKYASNFPNIIGSERLGPYDPEINKNAIDNPAMVAYKYMRKSSSFLLNNPESHNMFADFTPTFKNMRAMLGAATGRYSVGHKERHNIHIIKYLLSNPALYEDFLQDIPAASRKSADGIRKFVFTTIAKSGKKKGINEKSGLARSIEEIRNGIDKETGQPYNILYPVLNVFKTKVQEGRPSWVYNFNTNQFKEAMAHEIPYDIIRMLDSDNKDLNRIARFMYLYYYMGSAVTTPHSFGHMLPQDPLFKPGGFVDKLQLMRLDLDSKTDALNNETALFPKTYNRPDWFRPFDKKFIKINKEASNIMYGLFVQYMQTNPFDVRYRNYTEGTMFESLEGREGIYTLLPEGQIGLEGNKVNVQAFMDENNNLYVINQDYNTYTLVNKTGASMYSEYSYGKLSAQTLIDKNMPQLDTAAETVSEDPEEKLVLGDNDRLIEKKSKTLGIERKAGIPFALDDSNDAQPMLQWLFSDMTISDKDSPNITNEKRQMNELAKELIPLLPKNLKIIPYSIKKAKESFGSFEGQLKTKGEDSLIAYGLFNQEFGSSNIELAFEYMDKIVKDNGHFLRVATIHETAHAATVNVMKQMKKLVAGEITKAELAEKLGIVGDVNNSTGAIINTMLKSYKSLIEVYDMLKDNNKFVDAYIKLNERVMSKANASAQLKDIMMANPYEMVAYMFSHKNFRDAMGEVPYAGKKRTILQRIKDLISSILGLKEGTAGYEAFTNAFNLIQDAAEGRGINTANPEANTDIDTSGTLPMSAAPSDALYQNTITNTDAKNQFFYMREYNPEALKNGDKTISIRPRKLKSGIYKFGEDYYKVTNRGLKTISEIKETPEQLRAKSIGTADIRYSHIDQFYAGKLPMYVYDIQKIDDKDYESMPMHAEYVGTMPVRPDAFSTDDDVFNDYISTVSDYITRLEAERRRIKGDRLKVQDLTERIEKQKTILEQLQSNRSIRQLVDIGIQEYETARENALNSDASYIELNEGFRLTKAWSNLTDIIDFSTEDKSESEIEVMQMASKLQNDMISLQSTIWNRMVKKIVAEAEQNGLNLDKVMDKNGNFIIKDIGEFTANTISGEFSEFQLDQLMYAIKSKQDFKATEEMFKWDENFDLETKRILGEDAKNTKFILEDYEETVYDTETDKDVKVQKRGIITMYDRKFYTEYDNMLKKAITGEIKWRDFYKFERNHFNYELTQEGKEAFEEYMEGIRQRNIIDVDVDGNEIYDEEAIEKEREKMDPDKFQEYLDSTTGKIVPNSGSYWFTKTPKNIPLNPNYVALSDKQKEFHQMFSDAFMKGYENSVFDYRLGPTDIDEKLMEFTTNLSTGLSNNLKHITKSTGEMMRNWFMVKAESPLSKQITRPITGQEHIEAPFKNIITFLPENNNINPVQILKDFIQASIAFKHKRDVEELMNTINDITKDALKHEKTNAGLGKVNKSGNDLTTKGATHASARLDFTIRAYLTGVSVDKSTTSSDVKPGEHGFSLNQSIDTINKFTRIRYMAFSPISAAGNLLMGMVNNFTYAAGGQYYTTKELLQAANYMKMSPLKYITGGYVPGMLPERTLMIANIMHRYNIIGDVTEELIFGESFINKLFTLQKSGEYLAQGSSTIAQMLHYKVELADGTKTTLFHLYSLKNNRAHLDLSKLKADDPLHKPETIQLIFDKIKLVNQKIHGDYSNPLMGKKKVFGRMLFMFRTWLPMAIKERFGAEYEHRLLGTQKGRYISIKDMAKNVIYNSKTKKWEFSKAGALNFAKVFAKLLLPIIGKKIKLGSTVSDIDRANVDMFVREVHMYMTIIMATAMAKASMSDDDDDDTKGMLNYLFNQGERLQSELSMFYVPTSANGILQSLVPMSGTLLDAEKVVSSLTNYIADPQEDIYQRGFRKGKSKLGTSVKRFVPLTRSAESMWSSWSQMYNNPNGRSK